MNLKAKTKIFKDIRENETLENLKVKNEKDIVIECKNLNLWYDDNHALKDINMVVKKNKVTAIIGPSGCGKSTLIRSFNRMNDVIEGCKIEGNVEFKGRNIYGNKISAMKIRKYIGMIFQTTKQLPKVYSLSLIFHKTIFTIMQFSNIAILFFSQKQ